MDWIDNDPIAFGHAAAFRSVKYDSYSFMAKHFCAIGPNASEDGKIGAANSGRKHFN
jgi:hypothetical protein